MGGCATKPNVLKEEGEAPKPVEEVSAADAVTVGDTLEDLSVGKESKEEVVDGRKSLGNFFSEKEAEENNTATISGEKPAEEKEEAKPEEQDEKEKATEVSEVEADTAAAADDEEKQ